MMKKIAWPCFCALCYTRLAPAAAPAYLCVLCLARLTPSNRNFGYGYSLYAYTPLLRQLILRVKVSGDEHALRCLCALVLSSPLTAALCHKQSRVLAAPSSLWGRLRGRLDLAWFLSAAVAARFHLPHIQAPRALFWRSTKRARQPGRHAAALHFPYHRDNIPTLIIDDLITTGHTLQRVASSLGGSNCRFLTLGDAFKGARPLAAPTEGAPYDEPMPEP